MIEELLSWRALLHAPNSLVLFILRVLRYFSVHFVKFRRPNPVYGCASTEWLDYKQWHMYLLRPEWNQIYTEKCCTGIQKNKSINHALATAPCGTRVSEHACHKHTLVVLFPSDQSMLGKSFRVHLNLLCEHSLGCPNQRSLRTTSVQLWAHGFDCAEPHSLMQEHCGGYYSDWNHFDFVQTLK